MNIDKFNSGRLPSSRIISHSVTGCYAIVHFTLNTWTDQEWGYGNESPELFNPDDFDADDLVQACIDGGLDGLILVCKHHNGFCLWPTRTTPYNISQSPWRNGRGDLVGEVVTACRRHNLRVGFYVSPWDRNHPAYGQSAYQKIYQEQVREIYSNYGPAFEAWFDGANGGDGYYGGANEKRSIDASVYYKWDDIWTMLRDLQPEAAIYSDIGPDLRWCGNENGYASDDCCPTFTPVSPTPDKDPAPGFTVFQEGFAGHPDGKYFLPAECDFPLRPGWFYHAKEDGMTKTPEQLLDRYLHSVGNGCYMNIGLAPNTHGRLTDEDKNALRGFKKSVDALFANSVISGRFTPDANGEINLSLPRAAVLSCIKLKEPEKQEEVVRKFEISGIDENDNQFTLCQGTAIGRCRLRLIAPAMPCRGIKIKITGPLPEYLHLSAFATTKD